MIASAVIIFFSLILLVYWFRYSCVLILQPNSSKDYAQNLVEANGFSFPVVQQEIEVATAAEQYDRLQQLLDRDYQILERLIRQTAAIQLGGLSLESRMLMFDYQAMKLTYALGRTFGFTKVRGTLDEMSQIVYHLANSVGEQAASSGAE